MQDYQDFLSAPKIPIKQCTLYNNSIERFDKNCQYMRTCGTSESRIHFLDRCIINCKEAINPSERLLLESKCSNCQSDGTLHYQWSVYICNTTTHSCEELPDFETKTSTGLRGANIAMMENVLEIGATYRIRCSAWRSGFQNAGYVEYLINVNSPPTNGQCSVTPDEGFALETLFNVFCSGWWDKDLPLSYLIGMFLCFMFLLKNGNNSKTRAKMWSCAEKVNA